MTKDKWVWMPHPGHFICARDCKFFMNTYVGGYIVSTVGEFLPDAPVREIHAESASVVLQGKGDERLADYMEKVGYSDLGFNRKYETMVFRAVKTTHGCCPFQMESGSELDFEGYNKPEDAFAGHMRFCKKWSRKPRRPGGEGR